MSTDMLRRLTNCRFLIIIIIITRIKREVYRITRCGEMAICVSWGTQDPFCGKGRSYGVSDGTIRKSDGGFL